jgi:uncharacterized iron-regulated membrane protein
MITLKSARRWFLWHKWTSLICTIFLLMLCITGLPLVFYHEIEELTEEKSAQVNTAEGSPRLSLDALHQKALDLNPGKVVRYIFWDEDEPDLVTMDVAPSMKAIPDSSKYVVMNEKTGDVLNRPDPRSGFMYVMLQLHINMFAGIPGKLFLGLMGILFVIAIISGVMLYGPIMKKYDFGMIRKDKSKRLKWLDMHNMLGIVVLAWTLVVGLTGVINTLSDVVLGLWQQGQLAEMTAPYKNAAPLKGRLSSLDNALKTASNAAPGMNISIIAYPETLFSSNHHYAIFMRGNTPLTSRLLKPALIDAKDGKLTDMRSMPWFVNALFISEPLHFGDYGGLPLKIIWALFDIATIAVLISGLYLWIARVRSLKNQLARIEERVQEPEFTV